MKYFMVIIVCLFSSSLMCEDYIMDSAGERKIITEHQYSENSYFRGFTVTGTFTDNYGNYGEWDTFVSSFITDGKISKLEFSTRLIYQNHKKIYFQGYRKEGNEEGAGVGRAIIVAGEGEFAKLVNTKCNYSVKFFNSSAFLRQKCKFKSEGLSIMKDIKEQNN